MTTDPRIEAAARALVGVTFSAEAEVVLEQIKDARWDVFVEDAVAMLAAADAVDPLRQPGHHVEISEDCWTLQHPPECRADMLACQLNDAMRSMGLNGVPEGTYAVELTEDGSLFFPDEVIL